MSAVDGAIQSSTSSSERAIGEGSNLLAARRCKVAGSQEQAGGRCPSQRAGNDHRIGRAERRRTSQQASPIRSSHVAAQRRIAAPQDARSRQGENDGPGRWKSRAEMDSEGCVSGRWKAKMRTTKVLEKHRQMPQGRESKRDGLIYDVTRISTMALGG